MLTNIKPLFAIALIVLLQSCVKDIPLHKIPNDKLLLSKVKGKFTSDLFNGTNAYEFDDNGMFTNSFVYGKKSGGYIKYRPLQTINFISKGSWDFLYDAWLLDKVADNSIPQFKLGDWFFTYDQKYQVKEVEITHEALGLPSLHEYFTYNNKGQLIELLHGESKDNISFKVTYQYDNHCNLKCFDFYFGYPNDGPTDRKTATGFRKNLEAARKASARKGTTPPNTYDLVFKATVTSDNNVNPFSQQQSLLFYTANRDNFYFNDFFLKLMLSNPLQVKYAFTDAFGGSTITQTFKYTYNKQKYPITIDETEKDPSLWQFGDYIRCTKLEYIKND